MRFLLSIVVLFLAGIVFSQNPVIELSCIVKDDDTGKKMANAIVTITSGETLVTEVKSDSMGKAPKVKLELNKKYNVLIHKEGYIAKLATIDASYEFLDDLPPSVPFPIQVGLFQGLPHDSFEWLSTSPMIKFSLDQYGNMDWNQSYTRRILKKIALVKQGLPSEKFEDYSSLIGEANIYLESKELEKAKEKFVLANELWTNKDVLEDIEKCDLLIDKRDHPEKYANESKTIEEK